MKLTLLCLIVTTFTITFGQHLGGKPRYIPISPQWMRQANVKEIEVLRHKIYNGNGTNDDMRNLVLKQTLMRFELAIETYFDKFGLDFPESDPGYKGEITDCEQAFSSDAFAEWYNRDETTDLESSTPDHYGISDESPKIEGLRFSNADDYLWRT